MSRPLSPATARSLLKGWDAQQESFDRAREVRFRVMFDVVEAQVARRFHALDLGSGPGSLSARLLDRFPRADCVAVDRDPVSHVIGPTALGSKGGRLTWVDADLGAPGWDTHLGRPRFDVALSTTALHWLPPARLRRLYRDLARRIRPGGVFLNGDYLPWSERDAGLTRLSGKVRVVRWGRRGSKQEWKAWEEWWTRAERTPGLEAAFVERRQRFPGGHPHPAVLDVDAQIRALRWAGFRHAGVVWQWFENRVLVAVR